MSDTDDRLCGDTLDRIVARYGDDFSVAYLPESRRIVTVVYTAMGIIGNGGFEYLFEGDFEGDHDYRLTLAAFETIGAEGGARALRDALALFPAGRVHEGMKERAEYYRSIEADVRIGLSARFWAASSENDSEVVVKLADYIRSHEGEFAALSEPKQQIEDDLFDRAESEGSDDCAVES